MTKAASFRRHVIQKGDMSRKLVLVTGATGFVGRPLVAALVQSGYAVRAATRRPARFPEGVEVVHIPDLKKAIEWSPILDGVNFIVHAAGLAHARIGDDGSSEFDLINRIATQRLVEAAKDARVQRLIFISSVRAQVGASATHVVSECDEPCPVNDYGRSKLAAERAVGASGVPFTIFRPVVIYGPNAKGNVRTLIRLAQSPLPLPIKSLTARRSLLEIDNLISAVVFALNTPVTINETYLLADPQPMTIGEILQILSRKARRLSSNIYVPQLVIRMLLKAVGRSELWSSFMEDLVVDTTKFESTGWRAVKTTSEGLAELVESARGSAN